MNDSLANHHFFNQNQQLQPLSMRIDEVERIVALGADCGIEKDDRLFMFAMSRVFGEPPSSENSVGIMDIVMKYAPVVLKAISESESVNND